MNELALLKIQTMMSMLPSVVYSQNGMEKTSMLGLDGVTAHHVHNQKLYVVSTGNYRVTGR